MLINTLETIDKIHFLILMHLHKKVIFLQMPSLLLLGLKHGCFHAQEKLPEQALTLTEILSDNNYSTTAILTNGFLNVDII